MTHEEFKNLVRDMRRVQKLYFKTKMQQYLKASKALESQVDQELENPGVSQAKLEFTPIS